MDEMCFLDQGQGHDANFSPFTIYKLSDLIISLGTSYKADIKYCHA